jgi:hypothetical protein
LAFGDLCYRRVRQHTAYRHRAIGRERKPRLARGIDYQRLVKIGMILDLIGDEWNGRESDRLVEQSPIEIAYADMTDLSRSHGLIQQTLCNQEYTFMRPIQQQEIDIVAVNFLRLSSTDTANRLSDN